MALPMRSVVVTFPPISRSPRHQPRAACFVAMEGALGAQLGKAGVGVASRVGVGGGEIEDTEGIGPAVGQVTLPRSRNPRQ